MNAQEKQLIEDLFARLRNFDGGEKDQEAEWLIQDLIRRSPDAPYYLAQTVIVQQQALERAEARMRELEAASRQPQDTGRGGSFLGGSSVPQSGGRYTPPSAPQRAPDPVAPPPSNSPWAPPAQASGGGGGFLSSALSTAAGVAGGVFLADGIRSLFGGGRAYAGGDATGASDQKTIDNLQDQAQDGRDDADQAKRDLAADDAAQDDMQDAQDDGDNGWGSDDSLDI
jgi:uncharacterized protein